MFSFLRRPDAARTAPPQPVETGTVRWGRDLDEAVTTAAATGRPVFALFQEVPGCAGCRQFGADVLSDPLVVEAIEDLFVPLLIHNNASLGHDAEVLARYGEPAWNYQVVRFLGSDGDDLIPRRDRVWETGPLLQRMVAALEAAAAPVPDHLRLLEQEHSDRLVEVFIAQACFWVGEHEIGQIDGVVRTEAGFLGGHEVTRVWFDPEVIDLEALHAEARRRGVATFVARDGTGYRTAPPSDQKRQLGGAHPDTLTDAQLTKANAFVGVSRRDAERFRFPSQR
ncbi:MAG: VPGUxxT family thioredoxin-like (seleno)protein, type 2 [Actinomycetota bacterium]